MSKATPFLMFEGAASSALDHYRDLFPDLTIQEIEYYGPDGPGPTGAVRRAQFTLAGLDVQCMDSPVAHDFTFTPSISLFVQFEDADRLQAVYDGLTAEGTIMMALGHHGFSERFAWVQDKFGVSWQLNLG